VETNVREIIHSRANSVDASELARETGRVRLLLEAEKAARRRTKDVDIKYGAGGMLDVYFAMRYLQLRDNVPDVAGDRSTAHMLGVLAERGSIAADDHKTMLAGYRFLSSLDHHLRLTVGRTTRLPAANIKAMDTVSQRMELASPGQLIERLTLHRIGIRAAFENVVGG
jgi:glutamine synthetase adenylyltransferase